MSRHYLGIDIGTSGCRAIVINAEKTILAESQLNWLRQQKTDPQHWWQQTQQLIHNIGLQLPLTSIKAMAIDATSATVFMVDQGKILSPVLMYYDSCPEFLPMIQRHAPKDSPVQSASSSLAKLLYFHQTALPKTAKLCHQADWIVGNLTGKWGISDANNALKLGYDPMRQQWSDWLVNVGINPQQLPKIQAVGSDIRMINDRIAKQLGLSPQTRIIAGTTDSNAGFLATGANQIGDAVTSLGSTIVLKILSKQAIFSAQYGIYSHKIYDLWLVGGASNAGGAVLSQYFSETQIKDWGQNNPRKPLLELDYYPLPRMGERFPINNPQLSPKLSPRPPQDQAFYQAILEGFAKIEAQGYQQLQQLSTPPAKTVYTIGGGSHNHLWQQLRQHYMPKQIIQAVPQAQPAYGCALLALQADQAKI